MTWLLSLAPLGLRGEERASGAIEVLVQSMKTKFHKLRWAVLAVGLLLSVRAARSQDNGKTPSSYAPVDIHESFSTILSRMTAAKPEIMKRHMALLEQRYDLSHRPASGVKMSGGKAVQQGVRVKLPNGTTWDQLSKLSPEQIKGRDLFPAGFQPLPHPNHPEGGMLFPSSKSTRLRNRKGAIWLVSISTSTFRIISSRNSRRQSI
jgi:cytochrome c peroxidase